MEKRRVVVTQISATTHCSDPDDDDTELAANRIANHLMKILKSLERNLAGPISSEAHTFASKLLNDLCVEMEQIDHDECHLRIYRNLGKIREFANIKLAEFSRKLKLRDSRKRFDTCQLSID